ncbi:MAG: hypothetical protein K2P64_12980 [Lachnospiraceae bacterium]|nr:hypothetical protein [Lachnospiraceae bacterium]
MDSAFSFMDIIIMLGGVYLIYASVQMKRTGEISSAIVGKGYDPKKAKDPKGFIEYMYLKSILMGVLVIASGVSNYLNDKYWNIPSFSLIVCGIFFALIVVYGKITVDAQKKYLAPK